MSRETADILRAVTHHPKEAHALATLVRVTGSSYRCPGARMLIPHEDPAVGSISAGCLESTIIDRAREVLENRKPAWVEFDTRRHFGCAGTIEVFIESADPGFLQDWNRRYHQRKSGLIATYYGRETAEPGTRFVDAKRPAEPDTLVQSFEPPLQLLLIGEGPDSAALGTFATTLGWSVRTFQSALEIEGPYDPWTAAVIKTHNYGRDFAALRALLPLELPYVGLMGSRRRREELLRDLFDTGVFPTANLFAPAGLDLGGEAPEAIALAIVAEIQAVFGQGSRQHWRERRTPIHTAQMSAEGKLTAAAVAF